MFVGAGPDSYAAELRSLAAELGIGDDLIFTGGVLLAETVAFYRAADLLAYPSHNETCSACPRCSSRPPSGWLRHRAA